MKITEDIRKYAAEHVISEEEALQKCMGEEIARFVENEEKVYTSAQILNF